MDTQPESTQQIIEDTGEVVLRAGQPERGRVPAVNRRVDFLVDQVRRNSLLESGAEDLLDRTTS
jgi:hypothetical protein